MNTQKLTLEDIKGMLKGFDWYYEMSDDHRYWVKGKGEQATVIAFIYGLTADELNDLEAWWKDNIGDDSYGFKKWVQGAIAHRRADLDMES